MPDEAVKEQTEWVGERKRGRERERETVLPFESIANENEDIKTSIHS